MKWVWAKMGFPLSLQQISQNLFYVLRDFSCVILQYDFSVFLCDLICANFLGFASKKRASTQFNGI